MDSASHTCQECFTTKCTQCDLSRSECQACDAGFFLNPANRACAQCSTSCDQCRGSSAECTACPQGKFVDMDSKSCANLASGFFKDDSRKFLRKCAHGCETCDTNFVSKCTKCADDFVSVDRAVTSDHQ